jgi:hypothetical protein
MGSPGLPHFPSVQHAMLSDPGEARQHRPSRATHGDFRRVKGVVPRIEIFEAQSLQLALTACCLDPPVLNLWDYSRRPEVLFPVAGLPCRGGIHSRRNLRPCPDALTPFPWRSSATAIREEVSEKWAAFATEKCLILKMYSARTD